MGNRKASWCQIVAIKKTQPLIQLPNCPASTIHLGFKHQPRLWYIVFISRNPDSQPAPPSSPCCPTVYREQFPDNQNQALTLWTFSLLVVYCWFVKYRLSIESCCALHQASVVTCLLRKWFKREIMQWITDPTQPTKNWVMKQHNHHTSASHYLI